MHELGLFQVLHKLLTNISFPPFCRLKPFELSTNLPLLRGQLNVSSLLRFAFLFLSEISATKGRVVQIPGLYRTIPLHGVTCTLSLS